MLGLRMWWFFKAVAHSWLNDLVQRKVAVVESWLLWGDKGVT